MEYKVFIQTVFIFFVVIRLRKINTNYYHNIIQAMSLRTELGGYGSGISFPNVSQVFGETIFQLTNYGKQNNNSPIYCCLHCLQNIKCVTIAELILIDFKILKQC